MNDIKCGVVWLISIQYDVCINHFGTSINHKFCLLHYQDIVCCFIHTVWVLLNYRMCVI